MYEYSKSAKKHIHIIMYIHLDVKQIKDVYKGLNLVN